MRLTRNMYLALLGLAALIVFPALNPPSFLLFMMIIILADSIVILGFNLLVGYAGIPHLVPLFFMAVGAYTAGWISVNTGLHPFASIAAGGFAAVVSSFFFSSVSTRVKGWYMGLYSVIFFFLIGALAIQQELWIVYWTGGPFGILEIPDIEVGGLRFRDYEGAPYYYFLLGILFLSFVSLYKLVFRSSLGLAIRSIKQNEAYAEVLGVNPLKVKVYVFVVASLLMGVSAATVSHFLGAATPFKYFTIAELIHYHFELITGGLGSITGPIIGSILMNVYDEILIYYPPYYLLFKGLAITVTLILMPLGVMGEIEKRLFKGSSGARSPIPAVFIARYLRRSLKKRR